MEAKAHEYATAKAIAYVQKFTRPVSAHAVDNVYAAAFAAIAKATGSAS